MKICLSAIMKKIKSLEDKKLRLINDENNNNSLTFVSKTDKVETGYNYTKTRNEIDQIDKTILTLRSKLSVINSTTKVQNYDLTISEALIFLAQLNAKKSQLETLPTTQNSRQVTYNGIIEFTECLFDVKEVKSEIESLVEQISQLQMALDRTNLIFETEI